VQIGFNDLKIVSPDDGRLATITKLRQTFVELHLNAADINELVDSLNSVLLAKYPPEVNVQIKVDFPASWNSPTSPEERMRLQGYDDGKPVSRKDALPGIFLDTKESASVYDILELLQWVWKAPFKFEFAATTVIIKVDDYQSMLDKFVNREVYE
jgi:hypothetical protein